MVCLRGLRRSVVWALLATVAGAQVRARPMAYAGVDAEGMPTTLPAALRVMAAEAGVIFVGTVTGVRRMKGDGFGGVGVIEVRFRVEEPVRGVVGTSYTLREWSGLWPAGERGLVVGDRRLMLLHSPGATGLSSPVGGFEGAIPVVGSGVRVGPGSSGRTTTGPVVDLRWIAARLARPMTFPGPEGGGLPGAAGGRAERGPARAEVLEGLLERPELPEVGAAATVGRAPTLVHGVLAGTELGAVSVAGGSSLPVAGVVAWLREWTGSEHVER